MVVLSEELRPRLGDAAVRREVEQQMAKLLEEVNRQVAEYEQLKMIVIAPEPWSIENGLLTPTMKIKRARIEQVVGPKIEAWYGVSGKVVWG